jgi:hypothetical protein
MEVTSLGGEILIRLISRLEARMRSAARHLLLMQGQVNAIRKIRIVRSHPGSEC